jgi:hypothetical protein
VVATAAGAGHLHVLDWAYDVGARSSIYYDLEGHTDLLQRAAEGGRTHVIDWMLRRGYRLRVSRAELGHQEYAALLAAVQGGHLRTLQSLHGYLLQALSPAQPQHRDSERRSMQRLRYTELAEEEEAVKLDDPHVPLYTRAPSSSMLCAAAARRGDLPMLRWLRIQARADWNVGVCAAAASGGHLDVLKWLRREGCPWDEGVCAEAACWGDLEMLRWLRGVDVATCSRAVCSDGIKDSSSSLDLPSSLVAPWDARVTAAAAEHGQFYVLRWLHTHRCPWDLRV